jgi:CRP-like cAMP-binding protein
MAWSQVSAEWDALVRDYPVLGVVPARIRAAARVRTFACGEVLYRQGERPRCMLYVLDGEIRLLRRLAAGDEIVLQRSRSGFIAEASLDAAAYHCDVVAAGTGRLLAFPLAAFRHALEHEPRFNRAWIEQLARELRRVRAQSERLSLNGAAERIVHFIESEGVNGVVTLTQTRKALAAELGLTHETLYRTLRTMRANGTLLVDGSRLVLVGKSP